MNNAERAALDQDGADLPLAGMLVLDFGQFLAGPVAAMRLADLGARVVKVERPDGGDNGRQLGFGGLFPDGDALAFHVMNRNKESVTADLKRPDDLAFVRRLAARADVVIHNFRPGVMERYHLHHSALVEDNPGLIYASISGYGDTGPWADKPGQDLLAQARSGIMWLNGFAADPPMPVGLSIADQLAGHNLSQGILAALVRRERTGRGARVETSLLEAALDMQFEFLAAALYAPTLKAPRSARYGAHRFLAAPYGVYPTADGHLALAMNPLPLLGRLLELEAVAACDPVQAWSERDRVAQAVAGRLVSHTTAHWLGLLERAGVWCAPVLTLEEVLESEAFRALDMVETITRGTDADGEPVTIRVARSPVRLDGRRLGSTRPAPRLGADTATLRAEAER